jgi:asparagine synthase (glutamine-hydrolysing)
MSAIAGILAHGGGPGGLAATVSRMLEAMRHRAPDGLRQWDAGEVALGHGWFDTTRARDFLNLRDGSLVLAGDIRLDNRDELRVALGVSDVSASDAALVAESYLRWGEDCAGRLLGDFAFVVWDAKSRHLFCARDHVGVRPFHYAELSGGFAFASDVNALLSAEPRRWSLNEAQIAGFLAGFAPRVDETSYRDIKRLPPGHTLTVSARGLRLARYWSPRAASLVQASERTEQFRELFNQAVSDRMRGSDRVGALLSGGLDSSSICALAASQGQAAGEADLPVFSARFPGAPELDETGFVRAVLNGGGLAEHFVDIGPDVAFDGIGDALAEQGGMFVAPGIAVIRSLQRAAARNGVRVLLDGHGGDEVVSHGERRLHELAFQGRWPTLWRETRAIQRLHGTPMGRNYLRLFAHYGLGGISPRLRDPQRYFRRGVSSAPSQRERWRDIIRPDFAARTDLEERFRETMTMPMEARTSDAACHLWRISSPLVSHAFEVLNRSASASGVEARFPLWDKRMVEFCLALPSEERMSGGWSRLVLRRAMEGSLPKEVQWRADKMDFTPNVVSGLRRRRGAVEAVLRADSGIGGYVDLDRVFGAVDTLSNAPSSTHSGDVQLLWRTIALANWLRRVQEDRVAA